MPSRRGIAKAKADLDDVDILSEALSRTLTAGDGPDMEMNGDVAMKRRGKAPRGVKKAKRVAKRKAVKAKSASRARRERRRAIARK